MVFHIVLSFYSTPDRKFKSKDFRGCKCDAQNKFRATSEIINDHQVYELKILTFLMRQELRFEDLNMNYFRK